MVHTTFNSEYHFGKRSSRQVELSSNLYQVVINGEDGEYIEYEIEADSHSEASAKAEALIAVKSRNGTAASPSNMTSTKAQDE